MSNVLEVRSLTGGYGKLPIVFDVDFSLRDQEIVALIGPNGSGKSTLVKLIAGVATVHKGLIVFLGEDITRKPPHERALRGLGYMPQVNNVFPDLSVEENLEMGGYNMSRERVRDRIEEIYTLFPELRERRRQKAGTLSGGEKQMLAIGRALMSDPRVLVLDEPSAGLAPKLVERILRAITMIREMKKSIILVEQHARKALEIADRGIVMASGRIVLEGEPGYLLRSDDLRLAFMGKRI